jgi:dinuclear metal center YbgI/SA1388 family protein
MDKYELIDHLNKYLQIENFEDKSKNWLQVDNTKNEIKKIWYAVDITNYILDKAISEWVNMLIVHHGLYRWDELPLTWLHYQRVKRLIDNDICLYASHLPLDAHIEIWNNIGLLKEFIQSFWIKKWEYEIEKFGEYSDSFIWFGLRFDKKISLEEFISDYVNKIGIVNELYNFWNKKYIQSISFVSWWWASTLLEANSKWFDLLLTWEAVHSKIVEAKDLSQTICLGWHYETEIFGVRLLSNYIKNKYNNIKVIFLNEKY